MTMRRNSSFHIRVIERGIKSIWSKNLNMNLNMGVPDGGQRKVRNRPHHPKSIEPFVSREQKQ